MTDCTIIFCISKSHYVKNLAKEICEVIDPNLPKPKQINKIQDNYPKFVLTDEVEVLVDIVTKIPNSTCITVVMNPIEESMYNFFKQRKREYKKESPVPEDFKQRIDEENLPDLAVLYQASIDKWFKHKAKILENFRNKSGVNLFSEQFDSESKYHKITNGSTTFYTIRVEDRSYWTLIFANILSLHLNLAKLDKPKYFSSKLEEFMSYFKFNEEKFKSFLNHVDLWFHYSIPEIEHLKEKYTN